MAFLWKRVRIASALSVADVQERLAATTAGWSGDFRGSAVPRPPWEPQAGFVACQGTASVWLSIPLVVVGEVQPQGEGSRLTAVIRPHGLQVAILALASVLFPGAALLAVGTAAGVFSRIISTPQRIAPNV